jgi:hypothetical protein
VVLTITIYSIATYDENKYLQIVYPTPIEDKQADEQFVQTYGNGLELNKGLTINRKRLSVPLKGETPSPNELLFNVHNNTNEDIYFSNMFFNAQIYSYDSSMGKWAIVEIIKSDPKLLILSPKSRRKGSYNELILGDMTDETTYQNLRIFITGYGLTSGKKYGAYCDVTIIP